MDDITFEKLLSPASGRVIFRGVWGSHAYGTNTPESDRDTIGVFMMEQHHAAGSALLMRARYTTSGNLHRQSDATTATSAESYACHPWRRRLSRASSTAACLPH